MNRKDIETPNKNIIINTLARGLDYLKSIQHRDGSWQGDYGGVHFLMPMYIIACYIINKEISSEDRGGFITHFRKIQRADGSIGLHPEDEGLMFTTVLSYIALRLLGLDNDESFLVPMRRWIRNNGSALGTASWGKFFLCLLNLYPYEGLNPLLPELWLMPSWVPFHPSKIWCHARMVYLPMSYLYGIKAQIPENKLIRELRNEIYTSEYSTIDFARHFDTIYRADNYRPFKRVLKITNAIQRVIEKTVPSWLRKLALAEVYDHIVYEEKATGYTAIGPVNRIINTIVHYYIDPEGEHFTRSFEGSMMYRFKGHDGLKINGYNSTALWDTAFAVQAIAATPLHDWHRDTLSRAYDFIRDNQVLEDVPQNKKYYRHASRGGWPFSDRKHGWPITDCTAEGYKSEEIIRRIIDIDSPVPEDLLHDSIKLILSFQNSDGGWATYEKKRAGNWLELLNPASVFGEIMVDYSYIECTSSCIQALARAKNRYKGRMRRRIEKSIARGARFIQRSQKSDGGFVGSWAVCFTYGAWFAITGLIDAGFSKNAPEIKQACRFLIDHQNDDGGWGESYLSCKTGEWVNHERSQTVNTAWALMSLVKGGMGMSPAAHRAARFLISQQKQNGDWPRESLVGLFNKTSLINYENYRRYFPIWALGLYYRTLEQK